VLDLDTTGNAGLVVLIAVVNAVLGVALGLFCSAFARTEFQAVQFLPVVVIPQLLPPPEHQHLSTPLKRASLQLFPALDVRSSSAGPVATTRMEVTGCEY